MLGGPRRRTLTRAAASLGTGSRSSRRLAVHRRHERGSVSVRSRRRPAAPAHPSPSGQWRQPPDFVQDRDTIGMRNGVFLKRMGHMANIARIICLALVLAVLAGCGPRATNGSESEALHSFLSGE
jgi:hypothetical protein